MRTRTRMILVVEDDEDVRDSLVDALQRRGFGVLTATDGHAAFSMLQVVVPDAIVLDLMMPVMDGHAFLRLRADLAELSAIPVVIVSASRIVPELAASPRTAMIAKPFHLDTLLAVVERLCALHRPVAP